MQVFLCVFKNNLILSVLVEDELIFCTL